MFTGLIQQGGKLKRRETAAGGLRLVMACGAWTPSLAEGESIAVNGVCLTVAGIKGTEFACDVLQETLDRTSLGGKQPGCALNLERALRLSDPMGGHLVTGHVDGIGTLSGKRTAGRDWVLRIACAGDLLKGMVVKGSLAVDGVSLTIAGLDAASCTLHIIPFTWNLTSLRGLREGDAVNIETDIIGKHVRRHLEAGASSSPLTLERLRQAGYGE